MQRDLRLLFLAAYLATVGLLTLIGEREQRDARPYEWCRTNKPPVQATDSQIRKVVRIAAYFCLAIIPILLYEYWAGARL